MLVPKPANTLFTGVRYRRKELRDILPQYEIIRDCVAGETVIKKKGEKYLPRPNIDGDKKDQDARYHAYKTRAIWYNATRRTVESMVGQMFMRLPIITVPEILQPIIDDADGAGISLTQLAKRAARDVLAIGRGGIFVDYPETAGGATKAQLEQGDIRPTITYFCAEQIINWRTTVRGGRTLLSLVVIEEEFIKEDDGFEEVCGKQWRVLRLTNGIYSAEVYRESGVGNPVAYSKHIPTGADGNPFDEIPFMFIGSEENDAEIDQPPLYDIASVNIGHYRNSADYEESCFIVGQPTPVFTGLTEDWVANVLKGKVLLGSRGSVSLPVGGDAKMLQARENQMPFEAMKHKEQLMISLGARLVDQRKVVRTATEVGYDYNTERSTLASVAENTAHALQWALAWCMYFIQRSEKPDVKFEINTDFDLAQLDPESRRRLIEEWQSGGISWTEYRAALRKGGIATQEDEEARKEIDDDMAKVAGAIDASGEAGPAGRQPANNSGGGNDNQA